jgi:drug/metabolite transporter (DMT)-like permease
VLLRSMSRTEASVTIVFYYTLIGAIVVGAVQPFFWVAPDAESLLFFLALGTFGGVAQLFLTLAYRFAPASLVAPFDYSQIIWTAALGYLVFGDVPTLATWLGSALIVLSGLYILEREARRRVEKA